MPTWDETLEHLRTAYKLAGEDEDGVVLVWTFPRAAAGVEAIVQSERVVRFDTPDGPWLLIVADVAASSLSALAALAHNATLAVGALAMVDDRYVLRHAAPLDGLAWSAFDRSLHHVAHEAARLRMEFDSRPDVSHLAHYAD